MKIDLLGANDTGLPYSEEQFEADTKNIKPRIFDTYILPGFMMYYAWKSKEMRKTARRILFTSGLYMMYRNYSEYKKAFANLQTLVLPKGDTPA